MECLAQALASIDYETIIVDDDSTDSTAAAARSLGTIAGYAYCNGLAGAVWLPPLQKACWRQGHRFSWSWDADMQHDERVIRALRTPVREAPNKSAFQPTATAPTILGIATFHPHSCL